MIDKILSHKLIIKEPPVIIDLGASGESYNEWNKMFPYSIFLALDGEERKKIQNNSLFKKYFLINQIIDTKTGYKKFFQTKSHYCSSILKPLPKKTEEWFFHNQFKVIKNTKVKTTTLDEVLKKNKIKNIDILKIDLQGIDLKIFKSISPKIRNKIKFVDLEPSLYGFYENEIDNVSQVFKSMEKEYYVEDIKFGKHIKGNINNINNLSKLKKKLFYFSNKKSISYLNISFLKKFQKKRFNKRDLLIYICLLLLKKRYSEIYDILKQTKSNDKIFHQIKNYCNYQIKISLFKYIFYLPLYLLKNILTKFK